MRVDFGGSDYNDVSGVYGALAEFCVDNHVTRVLVKAGDEDPKGHYRLGDALTTIARRSRIAPEFKLALIPSTRAIEAVYREAQRHLRAAGLNAWVFATEIEAVDWLQGRSLSGCTAS